MVKNEREWVIGILFSHREPHLHSIQPVYRWKRKCMLHEKVIFHLNYSIVVSLLISNDHMHNLWVNIPVKLLWYRICRRRMRRLRILLWNKILLSLCDFPLGKGGLSKPLILIEFCIFYHLQSFRNICMNWLISPEVSFSRDFFLRKRTIKYTCSRIIEIVGIHRGREEIPECPISFHRSKYLLRESFPFFFCILFIENTIGVILQSDTPETKWTILEIVGIVDIGSDDKVRAIDMIPSSRIDHTISMIEKWWASRDHIIHMAIS